MTKAGFSSPSSLHQRSINGILKSVEEYMVGKSSRKDSFQSKSQPFSGSITPRRVPRGGGRSSPSTSTAHAGTSSSHEDQHKILVREPQPQRPTHASISKTEMTHALQPSVDEEMDEADILGKGVASSSSAASSSTRQGRGPSNGNNLAPPPEESSSTRRGRGPSIGKNLAPPPGELWHVKYNKKGMPIGKEGKNLHRRIGGYVRDPRFCPLGLHWKDTPQQSLEDLWDQILTEYDFRGHPDMKSHVFSVAHDRWKDWKNYLKKDIWEACKGDNEKMKMKLKGRVTEEQWNKMIEYWESDEGEKLAEKNSRNRAQKMMKHHSGSMTFAQLGGAMVKGGVEPEDINVFIKAYTPEVPTADPETVELLEKIKAICEADSSETGCMEPILTQVMGESSGKYVRGLGKHHKRKYVTTSAGRYYKDMVAKHLDRNQRLEREMAEQL